MKMYYKLYSNAVRSRLEKRAPMLEATGYSIHELMSRECWKHQPSIITDEDGNTMADNEIQ